jgi:hypothetical protein
LVIWATEYVLTIPEFMQFDWLAQVDGMMICYISLCSRQTGEGQVSSVGIATRYGLDGPGIKSRWGRDFPHPSSPTLGPTQPFNTTGTWFLPRGVALTTHPHLVPRLRKEESYTSTPRLGLHGLF